METAGRPQKDSKGTSTIVVRDEANRASRGVWLACGIYVTCMCHSTSAARRSDVKATSAPAAPSCVRAARRKVGE